MKKLLLVVVLVVLVSGSMFGESAEDKLNAYLEELKTSGFYDGDPNQNEILAATEDYIVIRHNICNVELQPNICDV